MLNIGIPRCAVRGHLSLRVPPFSNRSLAQMYDRELSPAQADLREFLLDGRQIGDLHRPVWVAPGQLRPVLVEREFRVIPRAVQSESQKRVRILAPDQVEAGRLLARLLVNVWSDRDLRT